MLELRDVTVDYGRVRGLHDVNLRVSERALVSILGANGAGKTTMLKCISGLARPISGEVRFCGERIDRLPVPDIVRLGVAHVPEGRRLFQRMTVWENIMQGAFLRDNKKAVKEDLSQIHRLFPRLVHLSNRTAGSLSGGEQQMVAIGRALMARPKLLLLDEPSLGLSPLLATEVLKKIREINEDGVTVLLVEQNARLAMKIASYAYVLETGTVALEGAAEKLSADERVRELYLGG